MGLERPTVFMICARPSVPANCNDARVNNAGNFIRETKRTDLGAINTSLRMQRNAGAAPSREGRVSAASRSSTPISRLKQGGGLRCWPRKVRSFGKLVDEAGEDLGQRRRGRHDP
jgi:hypothetical protein